MKAALPAHKTKIVATIGPASESPEMLARLIRAGMDVARLNFSHGNPSKHAEIIPRIRDAAREIGRRVAIMADLPGPKLRLGKIDPEPIQLLPGAHFTLTSEDIVGDVQRASTSFEQLPRVVKPGDRIFLNDGLVQLVVERISGNEVEYLMIAKVKPGRQWQVSRELRRRIQKIFAENGVKTPSAGRVYIADTTLPSGKS